MRKAALRVREIAPGIYRVERRWLFAWSSCYWVLGGIAGVPKNFFSESDALEAMAQAVLLRTFRPRVVAHAS